MKQSIVDWLKQFTESYHQQRPWIWIAAVVATVTIAFYWDHTSTPNSEVHHIEDPASASTYIPAGFVLVPIEVANYESLDSILGNYGIVDLYIAPETPGKRAVKVAEHLKILRAPLNPSHFAVLVKDSESANLVEHTGPFTVVVKNPNQSGTEVVNAPIDKLGPGAVDNRPAPTRSRITVEAKYD